MSIMDAADLSNTQELNLSGNSGTATITPQAGVGPKGDTGAAGAKGDTGATGAPGGSDASFASWLTTSGSATKAAADGAYARKNLHPAARLRVWGHSIPHGSTTSSIPGCVIGTNDMATLIAAGLGLPLDNQSVSGATLYTHISGANSANFASVFQYETRPTKFAPIGGVYACMWGINDWLRLGATTLAQLEPYKQAYISTICRLGAQAFFEESDSSVTYGGSGSWVTGSATNMNSGTGYKFNVTSGGTITITTPASFPGGTGFAQFETWNDGGGGTVSTTVNGTNYSINTTTVSDTIERCCIALLIPNLKPGAQTITLTTSGVTGSAGVIFDGWGLLHDDAHFPPIAVVGMPKPIDYSSQTVAAPTHNAPATATTGGSIPAGTYYAKITAVNGNGETTGSTEQSITTTGATSTITWNWTAPPSAFVKSYNVYVGTTSGGESVVQNVASGTTVTMTTLPVTAQTVPTTNTTPVTDAGVDNGNTIHQQVAATFGPRVHYIDASSLDHSVINFEPGNIHPSAAGHAALAALVLAWLYSLLLQFVQADLNNSGAVSSVMTAYAAFTPTLSGTGTALGNGTTNCKYYKDAAGKTHAYGTITLGSTSTMGSTCLIDLPAAEASAAVLTGNAYVNKSGVGYFPLYPQLGVSTGHFGLRLTPKPQRTILIGTASTTTITAPAGTFTADDVGAYVFATGVPSGATVSSVATDGSSAVISSAATATASNVTARLNYKLAYPTANTPIVWAAGDAINFDIVYAAA